MIELNREQILCDLERCSKLSENYGDVSDECAQCTYHGMGVNCVLNLIADSFSLIKELTEEASDWEAIAVQYKKQFEDIYVELEAMRGAANSYKMHNEKLTEERTDPITMLLAKDVTIQELNDEIERLKKAYADYEEWAGLKQVRADTVWKMQEKLTQAILSNFPNLQGLPMFIDQIAKEMLEGQNENI